jgi:hypothetical protein
LLPAREGHALSEPFRDWPNFLENKRTSTLREATSLSINDLREGAALCDQPTQYLTITERAEPAEA